MISTVTDLERFCMMLDDLGLNYSVHGPRLGVTTRITLRQAFSSHSIDIQFSENGSIGQQR